ncbi:grass carp reovirus (GCRV)-induced gene 2o isoform X2 [Ictalurus furcatus]|uniref:grass carp reovirus (GCRV)-induced gene 2o isoform X2 n=1 Tax=Ictalurus furcatus TaxID=66913 RepID=UPI002350550E|nr:grass carp reovirus (GCRV)-induced gene 2o isoform X2 [Ictalurus furcatus]
MHFPIDCIALTLKRKQKQASRKPGRKFMEGAVRFAGWCAVQDSNTLSEDEAPELGRVYTMFHGTHIDNAKDIIINGFKQSTRGMLGKGVYVSRNIQKAKCYPLRTDKNDQVVFKLKVNVGKVKKIDVNNHPLRTSWHDDGYDCAWVPPHSNISAIKSGREEDCVWDPKRITVVDVACCVDEGKRRKLRNLIRRHVSSDECPACRQSSPDLPHDVRDCWACGGRICPFEKEHVCTAQQYVQ